ncbi:peptidoglycan DD-metalloendopeptidase family protein [Kroppenstedtia eburnea]|uniref:peptidoglycan DD-metalloendopeptidase family protein n=1 Tax=Kroppenstedtia eburnea TaxID=714067 RepID=UPI00362E69DC
MLSFFQRIAEKSRSHRKGASTTEFLVLTPLFILCALIIWRFIITGMAVMDTHAAVRDAVKVASTTADQDQGKKQGKKSFGEKSQYKLEELKVVIKDGVAEAYASTKIPVLFMESAPFEYEASSEAPVVHAGGPGMDIGGSGPLMLAGPFSGGNGQLGLPVASPNITSPYGWRRHPVTGVWKVHTGVDFADGLGTPIFASEEGIVTRSGPSNGYGWLVVIDHGGGLQTWYAHMYSNQVLVKTGDRVTRGQQIAGIGSNGWSTGPHLHFEVRIGGQHTDPMPFLSSK